MQCHYFLNIKTIYAIIKTSSLPKTLRKLLLNLAVFDVGVGFLVQPFYTSLLVNCLQQNNPSYITYKAFDVISNLFSITSFLGVVAVSVDRFLAVHLHLRYQLTCDSQARCCCGDISMVV